MRRTMMQNAVAAVMAALFLLPACARREAAQATDDPVGAGWSDYILGEYDRAIERFESVRAQVGAGDPEWQSATYGLATTWNLRRPGEDLAKARAYYEELLRAAPDGDLAAWSALALARMKHLVPVGEDPNYDDVRKAYQGVMDRYPEHLAAKEAFLYYNATLISSLDPAQTRKAVAALEEFVKDPDNAFVGPAWSLIAVGATTLGDPERRLYAEKKSLETTEVDPTNPFTEFAWQYWNLATIAEFEVGDFDEARKYYGKLIEEYPQDIRVYGAKQALERMDALEEKIRGER